MVLVTLLNDAFDIRKHLCAIRRDDLAGFIWRGEKSINRLLTLPYVTARSDVLGELSERTRATRISAPSSWRQVLLMVTSILVTRGT
jgi:hypothetical protein